LHFSLATRFLAAITQLAITSALIRLVHLRTTHSLYPQQKSARGLPGLVNEIGSLPKQCRREGAHNLEDAGAPESRSEARLRHRAQGLSPWTPGQIQLQDRLGGGWGGGLLPWPPTAFALLINVLGPVPGVDVMTKRSQGWVKCEDRLPYYTDSSCGLPLATTPRPRRHDPREPRRGRGRPGSRARSSGALAASMQREGAVPDSFVQNKMTRASHLWTK
jgi:hypothetical protein